jgi:hypothetical protein
MTIRDKRWVGRVTCEIPARILTYEGWARVIVKDLSQAGVGISLSPVRLGIAREAGLAHLARQLAQVLPEKVQIEFDPARLGQTITRTLSVVRIRRWDSETTDILLGCTLSRPLTEEEAVTLNLALPFHGESVSDAQQRLSLTQRLHTGTPTDDDA